MQNRTFAVLATTTYLDRGKVSVICGMCSSEEEAVKMVERLTEDYKKSRELNKLLPKVEYSYVEV